MNFAGPGSLPPFKFVTKPPAPNQLGKIIGSVVTSTGIKNINLTLLAGTDWAAFGYNVNAASIERKATGGSKISALSQVGSVALANFNDAADANTWMSSWTDGTPDVSISNENFLVFAGSQLNGGLSFTVPAGLATQILTIYTALSLNSASTARAQLTATLSDQSAIPYNDTSFSKASSANLDAVYTIKFSAASDGQTLTVMLLNNTALAQNVQIFAAALSGPLALLSASSVSAGGLAAVAGKAPLLTSGPTAASGSGTASVAAALAARSAVAASGRAALAGIVSLLASGASTSAGHAPAIGKIALAAYGATKAFGRAIASVPGRIALAAASRGSASGFAAMTSVVTLVGRGQASTAASAIASMQVWLLAMSGGRGQASAPVKGVLTLTTASSARGHGVASPALALPLASLSGFGRGIANSLGVLLLKRPLFVDPAYIVQYPAPSRATQYPAPTRAVQYAAPIRSVSYPG